MRPLAIRGVRTCNELKSHLASHGVPTVLNYPKALLFYPAYAYLGHQPDNFPHAFANQSRILSLFIFPEMSEAQVDYVVGYIRRFYS